MMQNPLPLGQSKTAVHIAILQCERNYACLVINKEKRTNSPFYTDNHCCRNHILRMTILNGKHEKHSTP